MNKKRIGDMVFWVSLVAVVIVVLALCVSSLSTKWDRDRRVSCVGNLTHINLGIKMYAADHGNVYPQKLVDLGRYLTYTPKLFVCPASGNRPGDFETVDQWTEYQYVSGLHESLPSDTVVACCPPQNHDGDGGNILFRDGHIEWFNSTKHCRKEEESFEDVMGKARDQRRSPPEQQDAVPSSKDSPTQHLEKVQLLQLSPSQAAKILTACVSKHHLQAQNVMLISADRVRCFPDSTDTNLLNRVAEAASMEFAEYGWSCEVTQHRGRDGRQGILHLEAFKKE